MAASALVYLALFCTSLVHARDPRRILWCTTKSKGDTNGAVPVQLPDIDLPPPSRTWDIQIPQNVCPAPLVQTGVEMQVCDPDGMQSPSIDFINNGHDAIVQRNSNPITQSAIVTTTVFCRHVVNTGTIRQNDANVVKAVPAVHQ